MTEITEIDFACKSVRSHRFNCHTDLTDLTDFYHCVGNCTKFIQNDFKMIICKILDSILNNFREALLCPTEITEITERLRRSHI